MASLQRFFLFLFVFGFVLQSHGLPCEECLQSTLVVQGEQVDSLRAVHTHSSKSSSVCICAHCGSVLPGAGCLIGIQSPLSEKLRFSVSHRIYTVIHRLFRPPRF